MIINAQFFLATVLISLYTSSHLIREVTLRISTVIIHILQMRSEGSVILYNLLKICTVTKMKPDPASTLL